MGQTTFSGPVKSDNGFIENSFTTAERDALDPVIGLLIYNTTENTYQVYGNSGWQPAFEPVVVLPTPNVTTFTPTSGSTDGGTALTVSGSNFLFEGDPNVSTARLDFGGGITIDVTDIVVNSDTEFTCNTGASYSGQVTNGHLKAYNADGQTGTQSSSTFDYTAPADTLGIAIYNPTYTLATELTIGYPEKDGTYLLQGTAADETTLNWISNLPIGTVLTVAHGSSIGIGDTFTSTTIFFTGSGNTFSVITSYSGSGVTPTVSTVSEFAVA